MIGRKVWALFRDSYGNPNGGIHYCEIVDKLILMPCIIRQSRLGDGVTAPMNETHYLVETIDEAPEIRSDSYKRPARLAIVHCFDIGLTVEEINNYL